MGMCMNNYMFTLSFKNEALHRKMPNKHSRASQDQEQKNTCAKKASKS